MNEHLFQRDQSDITDGFVAGFYLHYRRGRVMLPVAVWFGPPPDLELGGVLDRSPRWNVALGGILLDDEREQPAAPAATIADVWPGCKGRPIDKAEYDYRLARIRHARLHEPDDPFAHPTGRVNHMTAPPPF